MIALTQSRLRHLLRLDAETGTFYWRNDMKGGVRSGDAAGCISRSAGTYRKIRVDGTLYYAHRLAWFYVNGCWPLRLDHKDGNGLRNNSANLRPCSQLQNVANAKRRSDNKSGFKGVSAYRGRWLAQCKGYIGTFDTAMEAAKAYDEAATRYFGEFARTNRAAGLL